MLIDKANEAGGRDNIGVVMAEPLRTRWIYGKGWNIFREKI